ncbi:MAG: DUF1052 domain-containing protein [Robiginitomaculum sp.]|nr:MAG: DUF1052 domain-containing protein [Robiginitomaculum sp.]
MNVLSHDELANSLAIHLINDQRMVWEDIPVGKVHSVRPDVLTIEKSYSSPNPISYEIKVSISDFRSDVTKAKWKAYLDFSYGVIFAVPKGLIKKTDVPNGCGLITFNGQSWNTVKRPTLHPTKLNDELLLKLLISGEQRETQKQVIKNRDFDQHVHHETLRQKFGKEFRSKIAFLDEYPEKKKELRKLKKELGGLFDIDVDKWCFEHDVEYHIKQLKIMADESERKSKIANELESMKGSIVGGIDRIISKYTKN